MCVCVCVMCKARGDAPGAREAGRRRKAARGSGGPNVRRQTAAARRAACTARDAHRAPHTGGVAAGFPILSRPPQSSATSASRVPAQLCGACNTGRGRESLLGSNRIESNQIDAAPTTASGV